MEHNCEFITGFHMEPGDDGDPIFCDEPAGMQIDGIWYCAAHFDEVTEYQETQAKSEIEPGRENKAFGVHEPEQHFMGIDIGFDRDTTKVAVFAVLYDKMWIVLDKEYRS